MAESNLTAERLRELLSYDPETGLFTWNVRRSNFVKAGSVAGTVGKGGYIHIRIDMEPFMAHRLAWFYTYSTWPKQILDHINGLQSDNRICNLRECSVSENQQNTSVLRRSKTGVTGARPSKKGDKYTSSIMVNGVSFHLGSFDTPELAHAAYIDAKARLHTFQPTLRTTESISSGVSAQVRQSAPGPFRHRSQPA